VFAVQRNSAQNEEKQNETRALRGGWCMFMAQRRIGALIISLAVVPAQGQWTGGPTGPIY
jgi:hypothetical protein